MKASLSLYKNGQMYNSEKSDFLHPSKATLVLGFGEKSILANENIYQMLKTTYSQAAIVLCSTSGEIYNDTVQDNTVSIAAIEFEKTTVKSVSVNIDDFANSFEAGEALVKQLPADGLAYIMIISDGAKVNGSELVRGVNTVVQNKVPVTGGLAGDAARFQSTLVGLDGPAVSGKIVGIGLYGSNLKYLMAPWVGGICLGQNGLSQNLPLIRYMKLMIKMPLNYTKHTWVNTLMNCLVRHYCFHYL